MTEIGECADRIRSGTGRKDKCFLSVIANRFGKRIEISYDRQIII